MDCSNTPDTLEERFLQPKGWRWHKYRSGGYNIRFGACFPGDKTPKAIVVILPGLGEFCEKYFETAHDLLAQDYAVWIIDWPDQGHSEHYLHTNTKRHSFSFQRDINALHDLYLEYIKHSSVHPSVGRIPRVMLAHSMGGNIGLRYLFQHPDSFDCAYFTAPLFGLKTFKYIPNFLAQAATGIGCILKRFDYAPGEGPWAPRRNYINQSKNPYSKDPVRNQIHNMWCLADKRLQVGGVTWRWLYEAELSCATLQSKRLLARIDTPIKIALAEHEKFVNNRIANKVKKYCHMAQIKTFPDSRHELLMEHDDTRTHVMQDIYSFIKNSVIDQPENLKKPEENGTV